jgi:hypothetical protein
MKTFVLKNTINKTQKLIHFTVRIRFDKGFLLIYRKKILIMVTILLLFRKIKF